MMFDKPVTTYRLQLHKEFTFRDAKRLIDYLSELGVTHIYSSPFFRASPGSNHGYDICDHNELNPEIGTREDFDAFVEELHRRDMGLIVDFVPNHMGISDPDNQWWMDVLENGPSSPYARFFDIEWHPLKQELANKVLLPILGDPYGKALESGTLQVQFEHGVFKLHTPASPLPLEIRSTRPLLRSAAEHLESPPDELFSILTALDNLPPREETDADKVAERMREKGVIQNRLARLCEEQPEVEKQITVAVSEWNDVHDPQNIDRMDALLSDQSYRLSYWRVAAEEINYRRFFDVNSLAGIRVELPEVFDATHELLLELFSKKQLSGVRIDHIDGLALPLNYLEKLRHKMSEAVGDQSDGLLLVEKILAINEKLRSEWQVDGTTGYEFASQVMNLLINRSSERELTQAYTRFLDDRLEYQEAVYNGKRLVMSCEVNVLGVMLGRMSEGHRWYRDFTQNALNTAIREIIACFPVYRTYIDPELPVSDADAAVINQAISLARRRNSSLERSIFDFIRTVLLAPADSAHTVDEQMRKAFVLKFQQCTSPISAKGVEDTAFYNYNRLVALNEVGSNPGVFGLPTEAFHKQCQSRLEEWPYNMISTSTHDTKRSEDVRMRILAISEMAGEWAKAVKRWHTLNRKHKPVIDGLAAPDANEEYLIYQTLIGTWPLFPMNEAQRDDYISRMQAYITKALHEAKSNSSWIEPNESWDQAVRDFIQRILSADEKNRFITSFESFAQPMAELGAINSLAQLVLKLTTPGLPDIYQGTEIWDFSLVDPDNRRPVDYDFRYNLLRDNRSPSDLLENWRDGGIKLHITQKLLHLRRANPTLVLKGSYQPLEVTGDYADSCVAYLRQHGDVDLLIVIPRVSSKVGFPPIGDVWKDTLINLPSANQAVGQWENLLTGCSHPSASSLMLAEVLSELPVAALYRNQQNQG